MRARVLTIALMAFVAGTCKVMAQDEEGPKKAVILFDRFTMPDGANATYRQVAAGIRNKIIGEIQKTGRVEIIDVNHEAIFQQAKENAASEDALESALTSADVRQQAVEQLNAQYAIQGHFTNMRGTKGESLWTGELAISLKLIDLKNGSTKATKNYSYSGITGATGDTEVSAVTNTADYLVLAIPKFVEENFKVEGKIIDVPTIKKNEAAEVYINLGEGMGIQKGQRFKVFVKRVIAGRDSRKEIGMLSTKAVEGDDISLCEVKKGGAEIMAAFKEEPESIVIVTEKQSAGASFLKGVGAVGGGLFK